MQLPQRHYLEHMNAQTSYRAAWLPDHPLRIGDVGKLEDGLFTLYTTLDQQGITVTIRESASTLGLDYSEKDSFSVSADASGQLQGVRGKASIAFNRQGGILFQITGSTVVLIDNLASLESIILKKYSDGNWPKEWVVITELIRTDYASILISTSASCSLDMAFDVPVGFSGLQLADPKLHVSIVQESGSSIKMIASSNLTPLYRVRGINKPFLGKAGFKQRAVAERVTEIKALQEMPLDVREFD
jgi:hypothetical protein